MTRPSSPGGVSSQRRIPMPRTSDGYPCAFHPRFQSSKACRSRLGSVTKVPVWTRRDSYYLWLRHYLQPGVFLLLLTTFCFWCSSVVIVKAQGATATLSGTVMDQNGAVIPGANITVLNIGKGFQRTTTTGDDGTFRS